MNLLNSIIDGAKVVGDIVDSLHTSDEEKGKLKLEFAKLNAKLTTEALDYEKAALASRSQIVEAEAKSGNWLTSAWRPITMLVLLGLVVADTFGLTATPLSEEAWLLLQLGIGGYVGGRSVEKVVSALGGKKWDDTTFAELLHNYTKSEEKKK